jgi:hypothetical protein
MSPEVGPAQAGWHGAAMNRNVTPKGTLVTRPGDVTEGPTDGPGEDVASRVGTPEVVADPETYRNV